MEKTSKNLLYAQLGAVILILIALGFGKIPTLAGSILVFGVIGLFGAMFKPRFLGMARYYIHLAVLSVVVVMTSTFFPFIGGKDYFFRFSVELALVFFILWWAFEAKSGEAEALISGVYKKPIFIAVTLFVLVFLLASVFAYDPHAAFWSNYERGEGGFEMLHYYAFFTLLILLLRKESDWRPFLKTSLAAATLMILYGVFANLGWAANFISPWQGGALPAGLWGKLVGTRFQGSLGNPAYVAPYLMFAMFYALYLWASREKVRGGPEKIRSGAGGKSNKKWLRGLGYGVLAIIFFFFFLLSQTRGAFLGFGAAIFAFLLYLILFNPIFRKRAAAALAAVLLLTGVLFLLKNQPMIKSLPFSRLFEISFKDQTAQTRFWTWGSAWQGFLERPVLGWGAENFSPVFDKYFNPNHYLPGQNSETWFDRAHSIFFDYLTETGVLGLLSYLSIFAAICWGLFKKRGSPGGEHPPVAGALMVALPIGYLVQGVAIFDVLPMYLNLFLFFAFSYHYLYGHETNA